MTFNTNLDTGPVGFDAASMRPRTERPGDGGGFAEVFDAQVRGIGRTPSRDDGAGKPDKPEAAHSGKKSETRGASKTDATTGANEARTEKGTEETSAGESAAETPGIVAEALVVTDGEEASELTPEQLLAALNGNPLPVDEPSELTPEQLLAALNGNPLPVDEPEDAATTAPPEVTIEVPTDEHALSNPLAATMDPETAEDALALHPQRRPAARAAEPPTMTQGGQEAKPAADDLLTAFRFSRMMSQEHGAGKVALEAAVLGEGKPADQPAQRGPDFLNLLNGMGAAPGREAAPSATQAPAAPSIPVPLNRAGWDQAFNERVVWMARQGIQEAHIQVTPREMGPIEVRISVQQDQATVNFTANNVVARDAIEAAMPRLRDMLADSGLNLVQSEVSQQSPQERGDGREHLGGRGGPQVGGAEVEDTDIGTEVSHTDGGRGMVDFFA